MRRHHITLGAYTTAGGTVVGASSSIIINGQPVALEGDHISCRSCKSSGYIVCDGPRNPEFWNGRQVALENDFCVCKCSHPPRLIANQSYRYQTVEVSVATADVVGATISTAPAVAASAIAEAAMTASFLALQFNDKFQLVDEEAGVPIANREYAIVRGSGEIEHGVTDDEGNTHLLSSTAEEEQVDIYA